MDMECCDVRSSLALATKPLLSLPYELVVGRSVLLGQASDSDSFCLEYQRLLREIASRGLLVVKHIAGVHQNQLELGLFSF
jgi:hypothetical protein